MPSTRIMTGEQYVERSSAVAPATPVPPAPRLASRLPSPPLLPPPLSPSCVPCTISLFDLPEGVLDAIMGCLGLGDLANASCTSLAFRALCQARLGRAVDLQLLPTPWTRDGRPVRRLLETMPSDLDACWHAAPCRGPWA